MGNPLIKEKIDLETEITKLNVLKSAFLSQKYDAQDKAEVRLPKYIAAEEARCDKLKSDVELSKVEQPIITDDDKMYYPIEINGKVYHDKEQAGKAIRLAVTQNNDILDGKECKIGKYRGFEVSAFMDDTFIGSVKVCLTGSAKHYGTLNMDADVRASGNMIRLDNVINDMSKSYLESQERLQALKNDLEDAKIAATSEFPQADVLAEKEKRLAEINCILSASDDIQEVEIENDKISRDELDNYQSQVEYEIENEIDEHNVKR